MTFPKYIHLKCVPEGGDQWDEVSHKLTMPELEAVVREDPALHWGECPRDPLPVRNSNGSVTIMKAFLGFSFTPTPGMNNFYICYEFDDGICVHTEGQESVCQKIQDLAKLLDAKVFPVSDILTLEEMG